MKASSIPHTFQEYQGTELPAKFLSVFELLRTHPNEPIAIGCIFRDAVSEYGKAIRQRFPNRPIWEVDGDTTITRRKEIAGDLQRSENGILIATQMSYPESISIPDVDLVIIEEPQWNEAAVEQFVGRFVRLNSRNMTKVDQLLYEGFDANKFSLVIRKAQVAAHLDYRDGNHSEEVLERHGINESFLDRCLEKEYDNDGKMFLTWGQQTIQ